MDPIALRTRALELALQNQSPDSPAGYYVQVAEEFYAFLSGEGRQSSEKKLKAVRDAVA